MNDTNWLRKYWMLLVLVVLIIGVLAVLYMKRYNQPRRSDRESSRSRANSATWVQSEDGWRAEGTPAACPSPLQVDPPADLSKASSVLYPGQMRTAGYEVSAGFRFDGTANNAVTVKVPIDGEIVQAARFLVGGEVQYLIDIMTPCGILHRFDHLLALPPTLDTLVAKLPEAKEGDSRTTRMEPPIKISKDDVLATSVGLTQNSNTFVSWGVFDFRQKNAISGDATWANQHPGMDQYAICPFDLVSSEAQSRIKSLPAADPVGGAKSDFCK